MVARSDRQIVGELAKRGLTSQEDRETYRKYAPLVTGIFCEVGGLDLVLGLP